MSPSTARFLRASRVGPLGSSGKRMWYWEVTASFARVGHRDSQAKRAGRPLSQLLIASVGWEPGGLTTYELPKPLKPFLHTFNDGDGRRSGCREVRLVSVAAATLEQGEHFRRHEPAQLSEAVSVA